MKNKSGNKQAAGPALNKKSGDHWRDGMILTLLGFLIYLPTLNNPMVFDDLVFIEGNPVFDQGLDALWAFNPSRFLVMLTFYCNHSLHGLQVWGYHFVNLVFHLATALLAWQLSLAMLRCRQTPAVTPAPLIALGVGMVVLLHPLQTQAVSYIWQRSTLMATAFYLAAMLAYVHHRATRGTGISKLTLVLGLAAMLCKEIAFTLPITLVLLEAALFGLNLRRILARTWPYLLLLPVIPLLFLLSQNRYQETLAQDGLLALWTPIQYLATQPRVLLSFLRLLILPYGQNLDYDYAVSSGFADPLTLVSLLLVLLLLALAVYLRRLNPLVAFGVFFFFVALSVEALAFTLTDLIFEHRLYLPMFGFALLVVHSLGRLLAQKNFKLVLTALVLVLAGLTLARNAVWESPLALWRDTAAKSPKKARPHLNLAVAANQADNTREALTHLDRALELQPDNALAHLHRAMIHQAAERLDLALADFNAVLLARPDDQRILNNRGAVYLKQKNYSMALLDFQKALAKDPDYVPALKNMGNSLYLTARLDEALESFNRILTLEPEDAETYHLRGNLHRDRQQKDLARSNYLKSIQYNNRQAAVFVDLATVLYEMGSQEQALSYLNQALNLEPGFKAGLINRGSIAFNAGNYDQAIQDFTSLLEQETDPAMLYRRGAAWLKLGNKAKALSDLTRAQAMGVAVSEELMDQVNSLTAE